MVGGGCPMHDPVRDYRSGLLIEWHVTIVGSVIIISGTCEETAKYAWDVAVIIVIIIEAIITPAAIAIVTAMPIMPATMTCKLTVEAAAIAMESTTVESAAAAMAHDKSAATTAMIAHEDEVAIGACAETCF